MVGGIILIFHGGLKM